MNARRLSLVPVAVLACCLAWPPATSQEPTDPAPAEQADDRLSRKARREQAREQAREERVAEYVRRQEEKLVRQQIEEAALERERQEDALAAAQTAQLEDERPVYTPPTTVAPAKPARRLPRGLMKAQANVRSSALAFDPTVMDYLDLIDQEQASPQQLAAFANFIAQNGMTRDALEYYRVALGIDGRDPVLWVNAGTLYRQLNDLNTAASAYARALSIDPNNSLAHYNLGAIRDAQGKYDQAVESYKLALQLDPSLGDPSVNPQAAGNELLTAVRMMLYREQVGSMGLPLIDVPAAGDR